MKNKHLLLIFCCTLLLGLLARYSPWFKNEIFHTDLVHIDSSKIERISILQPGQPELLLERSDEGWVVSQEELTRWTADSLLAPILEALSAIRSRRIVRTTNRDTLGLLPLQAVHVEVFMKNGAKERFDLGREIWEGKAPATYIEIDQHDGIYLADKHLRGVFSKQINDFRSKTVLNFSPQAIRAFLILGPNRDSLRYQKSDTAAVWQRWGQPGIFTQEQVEMWMQHLQQLKELPFVTDPGERLSGEHWYGTVKLDFLDSEESVSLSFFDIIPVETVPKQNLPPFLLISTQNPWTGFSMEDTSLLRKILTGPVTAND